MNMRKTLCLLVGAMACTFASAQFTVYDNGVANGINGWAPSAGWDSQGVIDDFTLASTTGSGTTFDHIRIEVIDGTTPINEVSAATSAQVKIYALGGGGIAALDFDVDIPVFDMMFTVGAGTMTKTLSGSQLFGRDLEYFDFFAPSTNLGAGHFGLWYNLPGQGVTDHFWATSTAPAPGETPDFGAVFGSGVNSALTDPSLAFNMTAVPEPGSMIAISLGIAALAARKRRKKA
jgi:hypothetical protein